MTLPIIAAESYNVSVEKPIRDIIVDSWKAIITFWFTDTSRLRLWLLDGGTHNRNFVFLDADLKKLDQQIGKEIVSMSWTTGGLQTMIIEDRRYWECELRIIFRDAKRLRTVVALKARLPNGGYGHFPGDIKIVQLPINPFLIP